VQEATFRIQILEQRAKRHDEISQQKFRAMVSGACASLRSARSLARARRAFFARIPVSHLGLPVCLSRLSRRRRWQLEKLHADPRLSALHEPMSRATDR
jgi:hypothetical protein